MSEKQKFNFIDKAKSAWDVITPDFEQNPNADIYTYGRTNAEDNHLKTAEMIVQKVYDGTQLDNYEMMLLPDNVREDLIERYNKPDIPGRPLILSSQLEQDRSKRRILKGLQEEKVTEYVSGTTSSLGDFLVATYDYGNFLDDPEVYSPVEAERIRQFNRDELEDNRNRLISRFGERANSKIDGWMKSGNLNYHDAYAYLATDGGSKTELDWVDFLSKSHPAETWYDEFGWLGAAHGIRALSDLSNKIERLDAADEDYINSVSGQRDMRDIVLFLEATQADRSFGNKLLQSFSNLGQIMLQRGAANKQFTKAGAAASDVFAKNVKKAYTTATSQRFRDKIAKARGTVGGQMVESAAQEVKTTLNPKGFLFNVWEETERYRVADQEYMGLGLEDGMVVDLNFSEPRATYDAMLSAFGTQFINNYSERFGEVFQGVNPLKKDKFLGRIFNGALFRAMRKANPDAENSAITEFLHRAHFGGIIPELAEERISAGAIGLFGVDQPGQDIKPGFRLEDEETGEWNVEFAELTIPSLEDFAVEVVTIAGAGAIQRIQYDTSEPYIPPMELTVDGPVVKGSDSSVREFVEAHQERKIRPIDTIMAQANRRQEKVGSPPIRYGPGRRKSDPNFLKKARERGAKVLVPELMDWIRDPSNVELVEHAGHWYGDNYQQSLANLEQSVLPELSDPENRAFFTYLIAATSPRANPEKNTRAAINEFIRVVRGADIDSKVSKAQQKNIKNFQHIAAHKGGYQGAMDFFATKMTPAELKQELFAMGLYGLKKGKKKNKDGTYQIVGDLPNDIKMDEKEVYAAEILGPKVGTFALNLSGVDSIPTIDIWMIRQIATALGDPFTKSSLKQATYRLEKAKEKGPTGASWAKSLENQLVDGDRVRHRVKVYREVVEEVTAQFNEEAGTDFAVNEIQALLWYMEKSIFTRAGSEGSEVNLADYLSVSEKIVTSGEVFDENTQRRIRTDQQLGAERQVEERPLEQTSDVVPGEVQGEDGTDSETADSETEPTRSEGGELSEEMPKKASRQRSSVLNKDVPRVTRLDPSRADEFYSNLEESKARHPFGGAVWLYDREYYQGETLHENGAIRKEPTLIMDESGKAGAAVVKVTHEDQSISVDIQSVFRDKESPVIFDEVMRKAIMTAQGIVGPEGIITLDCYDGHLPDAYEEFGFVEIKREEWNDEFASAEYPIELTKQKMPHIKDGKPDIVYMVWDPKKAKEQNTNYVSRLGLEQDYLLEEESTFGFIKRVIEDKLGRLDDLGKSFSKKNKRELFNDEDAFSQARRAPNIAIYKINKVLETLQNDQGTGFFDRLYKSGFTIQDLDMYLHALHAPERNSHVKNLGPKERAVGAGVAVDGTVMSNKRAKEIIEKFEGTTLSEYAAEFRKLVILRNIQVREQGGLLSKEDADRFRGIKPPKTEENKKELKKNTYFKHYVPLQVEFEDDGNIGGVHSKGKSTRGFGLNGPETYKIKGTTEDLQRVSPVLNAIESLSLGFVRAENNQVNLKLLNAMRTAEAFVNVDGETKPLFEFEEVSRDQHFDGQGNPVYLTSQNLEDNQLIMKENGIEYKVTINDPAMISSLKSVEIMGDNAIINILNTAGNFTKAFITSYNPKWWIGNFQADLQGGIFNLSAEESLVMAAKVGRDSGPAVRGIFQYFREPNTKNEWGDWYEEMQAYGGKVSFFNPKDYEDQFKDIDRKMSRMATGKSKKDFTKRVLDLIDHINQSIEGGVRLATYKNAREAGYSAEDAAIIARDITIDFNKSGIAGRIMEAGWRFSKVGVHSVYRMGQAIKTNPKKSAALGAAMSTAGYMLASMADSYDEEEYDKLSDWEKDHYWHFPNPWGRGFIPMKMPYGWGMFSGAGAVAYEMQKEMELMQEGENIANGYYFSRFTQLLTSNFAPINTLVPTLPAQMASEMAGNRDGIGRQIMPHKFDRDASDYEHHFPNVPEFAKDIAWGLSNAPVPGNPLIETGDVDPKTGRVKYTSRGLDLSPNEVDYLFRQVFGGTYSTVAEHIQMLSDPSQADAHKKILRDASDTLDPNANPWLKKFWTYKPSKDLDQKRIFDYLGKSSKQHLRAYELLRVEESLDALYQEGKIDLKKHNQIWRDIYNNQADLKSIPKDIREIGTYETDLDLPNPDYKAIRGPIANRVREPKSLGTKRGDLSDALDIITKEKQKRTEDIESEVGTDKLEIPE